MLGKSRLWGSKVGLVVRAEKAKWWSYSYLNVTEQAWLVSSKALRLLLGWMGMLVAGGALRGKRHRRAPSSSRHPLRIHWLWGLRTDTFGEDDLTALVGKWAQPDEGMGKGWHHMPLHCCRRERWYGR